MDSQQPKLKRVCAWCQLVLDEGDPGAMITHGMCDDCYRKQKREAEAYTEALARAATSFSIES